MRKINVSHAGCRESVIKKLSMASSLFQGRGISASISPWSGTRTDLVIVEESDPYGEKIHGIARRYGIPIINISSSRVEASDSTGIISLYSELPVIEFIKVIERMLPVTARNNNTEPNDFLNTFDASKSPVLKHHSALVFVDYEAGVCRANSHRDLLMVSEAIQNLLPIAELPRNKMPQGDIDCITSIENFFFNALCKAADIRWPHQGTLHLDSWPDINSKKYRSEPILISSKMLGEAVDYADIKGMADENAVSAFLYATYFSGLLQIKNQKTTRLQKKKVTSSRSSSGAVATLKKWLGMQ